MADPKPPFLFETAVAELRACGVQIDSLPGEYRVNYRGGKPETAYFTDDLADAIEHGRAMAAARAADQAATTPESTQRASQRKSHRKEGTAPPPHQAAQPAAPSASDQCAKTRREHA